MMTETAFKAYADTVQQQNWIDIHEAPADLPWYMRFGREIRDRMNESDPELSVCPNDVYSVEDLFSQSKKVAKREWARAVVETVWDEEHSPESVRTKLLRSIASYEVLQGADIESVYPLKQALENRENFFYTMTHNGSNILESLSVIDSESWIACIAAYSEREMGASVLARRWIHSMPSEVSDRLTPVMNRDELLLVTEITSLTKYADLAMIKLFDLMKDGSLKKTEFPGNSGMQYLFEDHKKLVDAKDMPTATPLNPIQFVSYIEMFPIEWEGLVTALKRTEKRVNDLIYEAKIPETYAHLSKYLLQLSNAYGSTVKRPGKLLRLWKRAERAGALLQQSDCPIVVHPMGSPSITGDASKIDPEFGVSLHLARERMLEAGAEAYREKAIKLTAILKAMGKISRNIPPITMLHSVASGGSNIFWQIQGISGEQDILCIVNRIEEEFIRDYLPILERVLGHPVTPEERDTFLRLFTLATAGHELGHALVNIEDMLIKPRMGVDTSIFSIDEVKADSTYAWFLMEDSMSSEDALKYIQSYLTWCLYYVKNNSSHDGNSGLQYYTLGLVELAEIIEHGSINIEDEGITIGTPSLALNALADLSSRLRDLYLDPATNGEKLKEMVVSMRKEALKHKKTIQQLMRAVGLEA